MICISWFVFLCYKSINLHFFLKKFQHYRSSRPEVFYKKSVLRSSAKFTEKHLCQSLFFNKVAGLRPATLLKKRPWHRCFPVNLAKFLRTPFFTEHFRWLLLALNESVLKWDLRPKTHPGFNSIILMILWKRATHKVLWSFDQFSWSYEVIKFWIQRE